jgi:hypothetical protein
VNADDAPGRPFAPTSGDEPHAAVERHAERKIGRTPPGVSRPGALLFEFVRASDGAPMTCELRFHGEGVGWEAPFFERGELFYSRGAFVLRETAVRWAQREQQDLDK